jgi:hypothetical protein
MALINCPECNKQVSDQATACPHCGRPLKRTAPVAARPTTAAKRPKSSALGCGCLALIAIVGFGGYVAICSSPRKPTASHTTARPTVAPIVLPPFHWSDPLQTKDTAHDAEDGLNRGHFAGQAAARDGVPIPTAEDLHAVALRLARDAGASDVETWASSFERGYATGYKESSKKAF